MNVQRRDLRCTFSTGKDVVLEHHVYVQRLRFLVSKRVLSRYQRPTTPS